MERKTKRNLAIGGGVLAAGLLAFFLWSRKATAAPRLTYTGPHSTSGGNTRTASGRTEPVTNPWIPSRVEGMCTPEFSGASGGQSRWFDGREQFGPWDEPSIRWASPHCCVFFNHGSSEVPAVYRDWLECAGRQLFEQSPNRTLQINGNASISGTAGRNQAISEARARNIRSIVAAAYQQAAGEPIAAWRLVATGTGATERFGSEEYKNTRACLKFGRAGA